MASRLSDQLSNPFDCNEQLEIPLIHRRRLFHWKRWRPSVRPSPQMGYTSMTIDFLGNCKMGGNEKKWQTKEIVKVVESSLGL